MSELARALAFVHRLAERAVTDVARDGPLTVLRTPDLPLVWDANHLRVEGSIGADARALAASAARRDVPSMIVVPEAAEGEALAPAFRALGWRIVRHRYMAHRGGPPAAEEAAETEITVVEPARRDLIMAEQWGTREVADQVLEFERRLGAAAASDRWFTAPPTEPVAASCRLLAGDGIGQVEDVGTAPAVRRRGLARAVVAAAIASSREAGHELTFLTCDADGWVSDFYASLGFEAIGLVHNFHRA
ncbi:MAG TPA: GNAT family N-acetyltransferase [Solirubrobacteraceae bacterium]|jgi:ribosomal protein S18 acetylase RimI-like enzyme|nr:GNAT family N-acetyltransferase [Solirubrobacteraceae bacterium]